MTAKAKTESKGELRNGSAVERGVAKEEPGDPEGALLKLVRSVRVFGWTGGSWSVQSVQKKKVLV